MTGPYFEIQDVECRGPGLKVSNAYRLRLEWTPADDSEKFEVKTDRAKPYRKNHGLSCSWHGASHGERFFPHRFPDEIIIKLEVRKVIVIWETITAFRLECMRNLPDFVSKELRSTSGEGYVLLVSGAIIRTLEAQNHPTPNASTYPTISGLPTVLSTSACTASSPSSAPDSSSDPSTVGKANAMMHEMCESSELDGPLAEAAKHLAAVSEGFPPLQTIMGHDVAELEDKVTAFTQKTTPLASGINAAFPGLLSKLEGFMKIGGQLAGIHPIAQAAWGVATTAYIVYKANQSLSTQMEDLVQSMDHTCHIATYYAQEDSLSDGLAQALKAVLHEVVCGCAYVKAYQEACKKVFSNISIYFSTLDQQAGDCIKRLTMLQGTVSDHVDASMLHHIMSLQKTIASLVAHNELQNLAYAQEANSVLREHNPEKGCLPGTRTAILSTIINWAVGGVQSPNCPPYLGNLTQDKHILWLCGVAGSGKSSIAMTVALEAHACGMLGAYYRFSASNQAQLNPSNLFSTIACHLASQNSKTEEKLVDIVKGCDRLTQQSINPLQQLNTFVLPLLGPNNSPPIIPHTIIVIDALDESGSIKDRRGILQCLAELPSKLPSHVHILVTSRYEIDVQDAVSSDTHTVLIHMDQIPHSSTEQDIRLYVHHMLKGVPISRDPAQQEERLTQLAIRSEESFQWASTACLFIKDIDDGDGANSPAQRMQTVLSTGRSLYSLYTGVFELRFKN
ncbi:hypothetical protein DL93DRAFT_2123299, partial [Clavulina sp. PMI_390]